MNQRWDMFSGLLRATNRSGMDSLIEWLNKKGMAECPASRKRHGSHSGGLVSHCAGVYLQLSNIDTGGVIPREGRLIASMLHDICKVGGCRPASDGGYVWNDSHPSGHGALSLEIIRNHCVELTKTEEDMIRYHMGPYGTHEFGGCYAEYTFAEWIEAIKTPAVKLMHFADNIELMG